ncbi:tetraacyldisaccharide 4'-kinase [Wenzhouxiangella sediminis]|uniref:Tetraacyldisaccharide 4'-kinase n=1 Tax=Wenzhouxiangella sediminis TaxID=1792836 RepID=A0A3E1KAN3_9GAMM|nr:tetraacyldisaccharide 4'-kinase [Wenzhouxiangella sediminis]RFF31504.1 tetraacyldisaccharide 4'-kinase [Wenzhouxiangella sediminis]
MKGRLERYLTGLWYSQRRVPLWLRALVPVYRAVAASRWRPSHERPPCPVIVVGNITVGGSGKTPVVAALARLLAQAGHAPAVISRGYGGRNGDEPRAVTPSSDPESVGDEPVLLARRAGCAVWVCRDRRAALDAARSGGADVVLSDDGLQHPRLPRSYEICVVDGLRGLGNGRLLPAGPLRQPVDRLDSVDQVLVKQAAGEAAEYRAAATPFAVAPGRPYLLGGGRSDDTFPAQAEFDAVCAIGNPDSFFALLEALGYRFRARAFPDHHAFAANDFKAMEGPLLVTEKDAVKLERLAGLPRTWVLPIEARLPEPVRVAVLAHVREFLRHE